MLISLHQFISFPSDTNHIFVNQIDDIIIYFANFECMTYLFIVYRKKYDITHLQQRYKTPPASKSASVPK
jgi:hypothetical protein